ncbi:MAG: glycosyltransferase [Halofilum sp. (in: g-proteobacteria)]|nr:glycosyltransferase [Halofilum sp. (in: g-proteobacteria)]
MPNQRIALIASRFRDGGVERWMARLADGLDQAGRACDLVVGETPAATRIASGVTIWSPATGESMPNLLRRYLDTCDPAPILIPFRTTDFSTVLHIAHGRSPRPAVFLATGTFIRDRIISTSRLAPRYWKARWRLTHEWPQANGILTVSPEVADDWRATGAFGRDRIHAPTPPVVGPDLLEAARQPLEHPAFKDDGVPVILGVGRFHHQKGFDRLVDGFARLRTRRAARLVLLGQGEEETRLREQVSSYGIADHVAFPGFVDNPWNWMRHSRVLVAPSRTETFGFALVESLYVGTPFVADAVPPGPRSIQRATGCGELIDTSDADALARALERELDRPISAEALSRSAQAFDSAHSAGEYLAIMDGEQ